MSFWLFNSHECNVQGNRLYPNEIHTGSVCNKCVNYVTL